MTLRFTSILLRKGKQRFRKIGQPITQVAEVLARGIRISDNGDKSNFLIERLGTALEFVGQKHQRGGEDRQQAYREKDQSIPYRQMWHDKPPFKLIEYHPFAMR